MPSSRSFIAIFLVSLVLSAQGRERPNVLFIMSDDQSRDFIGAYDGWIGEYVSTPHIDRLADEGARLDNAFCSNSLCAPSRATIVTGQYSHKHGVYTLREDLNTKDLPTSASVLQNAGYQTAVVGKWHIHGDNKYGFDYYAVTHSQGSYTNPSLATPDGKLQVKGHSSDAYTDVSLKWLEERDKTRPFFLMHHFKAAHGPWEFNPKYAQMYEGQTLPEPATLFDDYANRDPAGVPMKRSRIHTDGNPMDLSLWMSSNKKGKSGEWPTGKLDLEGLNDREIKQATYQKYVKDYLRCVKGIDDNVGRLLSYLEAEGILDNTIVIYTADQGFYVGEHGFFDKRLGLEEGMRMPLLVRYPKTIKAGTVIQDLVSNVDYPSTIIDYAGLEIPNTMQGHSFRPQLDGRPAEYSREGCFYGFYSSSTPKHYGLRTADFKLLKYAAKDGSIAGADLFDLTKDPNELKSVINDPEYASVLAALEQQLADKMIEIEIEPNQLPGMYNNKKQK